MDHYTFCMENNRLTLFLMQSDRENWVTRSYKMRYVNGQFVICKHYYVTVTVSSAATSYFGTSLMCHTCDTKIAQRPSFLQAVCQYSTSTAKVGKKDCTTVWMTTKQTWVCRTSLKGHITQLVEALRPSLQTRRSWVLLPMGSLGIMALELNQSDTSTKGIS
jgi:hypothetical protein